jgi:hypothetical protein
MRKNSRRDISIPKYGLTEVKKKGDWCWKGWQDFIFNVAQARPNSISREGGILSYFIHLAVMGQAERG